MHILRRELRFPQVIPHTIHTPPLSLLLALSSSTSTPSTLNPTYDSSLLFAWPHHCSVTSWIALYRYHLRCFSYSDFLFFSILATLHIRLSIFISVVSTDLLCFPHWPCSNRTSLPVLLKVLCTFCLTLAFILRCYYNICLLYTSRCV